MMFDGFFLSFEKEDNVNDKDITASLFIDDKNPIELGSFVFNKSKKYGSKCFFTYNTNSLYSVAGYVPQANKEAEHYNYFNFPFYAFEQLGLLFNNVTYLEIACDTEASIINRIRYAVGRPKLFDMVLLWKKVDSPKEILNGYWEYYQRSRLKKANRPTLYIHSTRWEAGNMAELKVYDKAREMAQSRPDKQSLVNAWNGMSNNIQRIEIAVQNKQFNRFYKKMQGTKNSGDKWNGIEHFFFDLGMNESLRMEMFDYFSNHLLHFKLKNHQKTQVSILDLSVNSLAILRSLKKK